jgi:hypothetical protein
MCLPKKLVYDIRAARADSHIGWRVKGNTSPNACRQPESAVRSARSMDGGKST